MWSSSCLLPIIVSSSFALLHCQGKELFLGYHGVETVLPFMKPSNKALCAHAVDIYLQLSVESSKNNGSSYRHLSEHPVAMVLCYVEVKYYVWSVSVLMWVTRMSYTVQRLFTKIGRLERFLAELPHWFNYSLQSHTQCSLTSNVNILP